MKASQKLQDIFREHLSLMGYSSLLDVAERPCADLHERCQGKLTYSDTQALYQAAKQYVSHLQREERRMIIRANPQLQSMSTLKSGVDGDIGNGSEASAEGDDKPTQANYRRKRAVEGGTEPRPSLAYVAKNSVASMFSPAAYLATLYREGKTLHTASQNQHLDKRRPDLKALVLSQSNLDTEISALTLSNKILEHAIGDNDLDRRLACSLYPFDLPYHAPFCTLESVLKLQNTSLDALAGRLVSTLPNRVAVNTETCAAFANHLPPTLVQQLTTPLPSDEGNLLNLLKLHYDTVDVTALLKIDTLCQRTGLRCDALYGYLGLVDSYPSRSLQLTVEQGYLKFQSLTLGPQDKPDAISVEFFIKLSQLIRYSKATGLSLATLDRLIVLSSANPDRPTITELTLLLTGQVLRLMTHYGLNEDDAVVLAGGDINTFGLPGVLSQFDRLFNSPVLNGQRFTIDNTADSLDFAPKNASHVSQRAVLKRVLGVDDAGLLSLAQIANPLQPAEQKWTRSLANLSLLYRIGLLARVHGLTPQALQCLLQWNNKNQVLLGKDSDGAIFRSYLEAISASHQWLTAQKLTVGMLNAMLTQQYSETLTPEIDQFLQTLYHVGPGMVTVDKEILATHITASLELADRKVALLLEEWIDQVASTQQLTLTSMQAFWEKIIQCYGMPDAPQAHKAPLAQFSQALAQLALIVKTFKLSVAELALLVKNRQTLTLSGLQAVSQLKALQQAVGTGAPEMLSLLGENKLTVSTLARFFNQPEAEVKQAAHAIDAVGEVLSYTQAAQIADWLREAQLLGVSVVSLEILMSGALRKFEDWQKRTGSGSLRNFNDWQKLAGAFQAGLTDSQHTVLVQMQDEALSAALCAYYLAHKASALPLKNRDDVFQYLLIDNQVSAKVRTTRIAEAIASVQLYINRCLQRLELNVDGARLQERFFTEWGPYNKRYATWVGVSQLVYYPENYIDPTLRYKQSNLQRQLLTEISQSQLSKETVEKAYWNYLNSFEEVANLKVLCGYLDAVALDQGLLYFTGRSITQPYRYYWRSLDNKAGDGLGAYAASAWSAWEEIQTPIQAVNDEVRPVIFNNRLYIGWIACKEVADAQPQSQGVMKKKAYSLELSYRQMNGSWSPAMQYPLESKDHKMPTALLDNANGPQFQLYLSYHSGQDKILCMLYHKNESYGGWIDAVMQFGFIQETVWSEIRRLVSNNLTDRPGGNKVIRHIHVANFKFLAPVPVTRGVLPEGISISDDDIKNVEVDNNKFPPSLSYRIHPKINLNELFPRFKVFAKASVLKFSEKSDFHFQFINMDTPVITNFMGNFIEHKLEVAVTTYNNAIIFPGGEPKVEFKEVDDDIKWEMVDVNYKIINNRPCIEITLRNLEAVSNTGLLSVRRENGPTLSQIFRGGETKSIVDRDPESGEIKYDIFVQSEPSVSETILSKLTISNYYPQQIFKDNLTIKFGDDLIQIPPGPMATHSKTLIHRQSIDHIQSLYRNRQTLIYKQPIFNNIILRENIDFSVRDASSHYWTCDFTMVYEAIMPWKCKWDNEEDELTLDESRSLTLDRTYVFDIPPDGLNKKHTLIIKDDKGNEVYHKIYSIHTKKESGYVSSDLTHSQMIIVGNNQEVFLTSSKHPHRTRLNTLFSRNLINLAQSGLDRVLSWETQQLQEPKLGKGGYVDIEFEKYDPSLHGDGKGFKVYLCDEGHIGNLTLLAEGELHPYKNVVQRVYVPYTGRNVQASHILHIGFEFANGKRIESASASNQKAQRFQFKVDSDLLQPWEDNTDRTQGVKTSMAADDTAEPMDFRGANGLYFWELFYYTPMLVVEKLLQTQNFEEAERWLKYVFNPAGYSEGDAPNRRLTSRVWNFRPLEEDTTWDDVQTDSSDPDVVAQGNPIHYKIATAMKLLDLLIARGDMAYRRLERDTLAEAKMWYVTALNMMGDGPKLPLVEDWHAPALAEADLRRFHPVENDKLTGYWQTLRQRLYCLRHNLSIDGQPLTLPLFAQPTDPKALQSVTMAAAAGSVSPVPSDVHIGIQRFAPMLDGARNLVSQLIQFGGNLVSVLERNDGERLNTLIQTQARDLMHSSLQMQNKTMVQLQAEQRILAATLAGATQRRDSYQQLLDEGISRVEQQAIDVRISSGAMSAAANALRMVAAGLDMAPNIFGMAAGGMRWGAMAYAASYALDGTASTLVTAADAHNMSEQYRRRTQEWTIQRDAAKHECKQIEAQQASLKIQLEAGQLQKGYLETQQQQIQAQLEFLKSKFSNSALYSWMQGRLSAVFYPFYDLVIARCLKAQLAFQWETKESTTFIQPGAWDSHHAGLLCGEVLMLNLAQMEAAYLAWDRRALEVSRTVSMAKEMGLDGAGFNKKIKAILNNDSKIQTENAGQKHKLEWDTTGQLIATVNLSQLGLQHDYPNHLGHVRRIKQISITLPALLGPYQDIQAVLSYSGQGQGIHQSCRQAAISHGVNDSGLFQLDFNDARYLPFEGLPIGGEDEQSSLTLSFPNAKGKQQAMVASLNDIVLHIRYTIRD